MKTVQTTMQLIFILLVAFSKLCGDSWAQNLAEEHSQERRCQSYGTCDSCIQAESYCVWCFEQTFNSERCGLKSMLLRRGCLEKHLYLNNANSSIGKTDSDKNFNDVTNPNNLEESVQIKPQKITVKLHQRQPLTFQFKYRLAKNYPLDLYYLMDLTLTMEPDVKTMANLGKELTEVLQNLTQHFRVGFGYYSDKVAMPFSKMTSEFLQNPCANQGRQCERAFDFIHSLNFTNDVDQFIAKVNKSRTTSNLDNLEGGFDALYQIILCEEHIQWRKNSRKIIVVATDGTIHFAGDGILAGAVKRNADECFLNENGVYDQSLVYDYPSLEEVYHRLLKHKMNVLFAAKDDALRYYQDLNKVIPTVSYVGKLAENSTNVLNLVKEGYFNVVRNVKFSANASENLKVTFHSLCNAKGAWNMSSMCDNIEEGKEYVFNVTLEVKQIPKHIETEIITIEEQNIAEKLMVEVEYVDKCKCNMEDQNLEVNRCSNHGNYKCGVCECNEGWKGVNCEINCVNQRYEDCRYKNESYTSSTCYGHGECDCGNCVCDNDYKGKFCDEKQCRKNRQGEVCSGPHHGICKDGNCHCNEMYTGEDCSCPKSTKNCKAPGNEEVCSGRGACVCGKCICENQYSGAFCEICSTCTGLCSLYEDCVLDTLNDIVDSQNCFKKDGTTLSPRIVNYSISDQDVNSCYMRREKEDGHICDTNYKYTIRKDLAVELDIYDVCYKPLQAGALIGIIIGVIFGIGVLLILLWKARLMNADRLEYAKFKENLRHSKTFGENPLYDSPIRSYEMPTELRQLHRNNS